MIGKCESCGTRAHLYQLGFCRACLIASFRRIRITLNKYRATHIVAANQEFSEIIPIELRNK